MERAALISASGGGVVVQPAASHAAIVQSSFLTGSPSSYSMPRGDARIVPGARRPEIRGMR
jgi:hypothetical protein